MTTQSLASRLSASRAPSLEQHSEHHALESLLDAVDRNDTYRRGHSRRVASYAGDLARVMGSSQTEAALVHLAGLLHDVGKIGIPEWLLRKRGDLTEAEMHLLRLHPIIGASILSRMPDMETIVPIVLHHHECWDGSGYPSGLKGVDIPVQSRMLFTIEAYDAITSKLGDDPKAIEKALEELRKNAGKSFDPLTVDAMHELWRNGMLDPDEAAEFPRAVKL